MTRTPVVGEPAGILAPMYVPGAEALSVGEIRVSVLGSGDPWIRRSQASGSPLIEVGNPERDFFFFDLGSGSLANFTSLMLPVEATTKVFLSHLHADHIGDIPGLPASYLVTLGAGADSMLDLGDVRSVLIAVAPVVGAPRVVSAVRNIAEALGIAITLDELMAESEAETL